MCITKTPGLESAHCSVELLAGYAGQGPGDHLAHFVQSGRSID